MMKIVIHIIPAILLSFLLQLILHEVGHMLGGLLSGWRLIYVQLFYLAVIKKSNRYRFKIINVCGFQCIMYPLNQEKKALLYTAGGLLTNLAGVIAGLVIMIIMWDNHILCLYAWSLLVSGIILFFVNGFPKAKRICNDGACFKLLKSDPVTRRIHNNQLLAARQLSEGFTYKEIGPGLIHSPESADNDILAYQAILEYYYWLDVGDDVYWQAVPAALLKAVDNKASRSVQDIIKLEGLYYEIIKKLYDMNTDPIELFRYGNNIKDYIRSHGTEGDVHTERVRAVYEVYGWLMKGQSEKALQCIEKAVLHINNINCFYPGEALFCVSQLERLKLLCI